jgi:plasmid stability protein
VRDYDEVGGGSSRAGVARLRDPTYETYGKVYVMKKTTVYLPEDLKAALERAAAAQGRSEAELIRDAVRDLTRGLEPPRPRLPLFSSGDPTLAERVDEELARGFGR